MRTIALSLLAILCAASETENHGLRVLPAPGPVAIDGSIADWDLSGGIFACGEVEHLRERCAVWIHAMYDADRLYVLARWKDPTPLNNPERFGGHAFNGDCLQLRFVFDEGTPQQTATWWNAWCDATGRSVVDRDSPGQKNGFGDNPLPHLSDAELDDGAKQAFTIDRDGHGYVQELSIPWRLLSAAGRKPDGRFRMTVEPNFTAGEYGRITIKDLFDPQIPAPDKVFTFRAFKHWGWATLESAGAVAPQAVRLADGRTFPVTLAEGKPQVAWDGLDQRFAWPGFKPLTFTLPTDGYVSLNILDHDGVVVRHLLNWDQRSAGQHTVQWDGLSDPVYRTPGEALPAGEYTWQAITHPGATLTLRGWASDSARAPWIASPLDHWLGDHGVPSAVASDGQRMYLACNGAEGGRHLLATDLDGHLLWGLQNTTGAGDPEAIAVGDGAAYVVHPRFTWLQADTLISRVDPATGAYTAWPKGASYMLTAKDLWGAAGGPGSLCAIDARDGRIYVTCSETRVFAEDIRDWQKLLARLAADAALTSAVLAPLDKNARTSLDQFAAGQYPAAKAFGRGGAALAVLNALNALLVEPGTAVDDLVDGTGPAQRLAKRRDLESRLGDALTPAEHCLAVLDPASGAALKRIPLPSAGAVHALDRDTVLVAVADGLVAVNPDSGVITPFASGLGRISGITVDPAKHIFVTLGAPHWQVVRLAADGSIAQRFGRDGGRPELGAYQPDGMYHPAGLAIAPDGKLWVAERDAHPKRVSVWQPDGTLANEFFGPTQYGANGAAIDPLDPNRMVGVGCEWELDPHSGQSRCVATFDHRYHDFATFRVVQGRTFLYTYAGKYSEGEIRIFERVGLGKAKHGSFALRTVLRPQRDAQGRITGSELWTDANADEVEQPDEVQQRTGYLSATGSNGWSMNLGPDLALYAFDRADQQLKRLSLAGFSAAGAPRYDLAALAALPPAFSDGYRENSGCALPSADNTRILLNLLVPGKRNDFTWVGCDLASGKRLWSYPNPYFQVHGSHAAPTPEAGLFRGAFGPVGAAKLPGVGNFWAISGNLGEWGVLSGDGFYVTRLFNGNVFEWQWPKAVPGADLTKLPAGCGGEDFGGSLTQTADGKVYVQAGKSAIWNLALDGLERTTALPGGTLTLSAADLPQALALRELALQKTAASASLTVKRAAITFTGKLTTDFATANQVSFTKSPATGVRCALTRDDSRLFAAWEVADPTPWVNGATDWSQMYACGDTVDLQLATDPAADPKRQQATAGDLRLSIGNLGGKPTAVSTASSA